MIRYLLALILSLSAFAAPATVRVTMPTAYSDGTTLPAADRVGAAVYCGPTAGRYVQQWFTAGVTDVVDVQADVTGRVFCAVTAFASVAGSVRESGYSTEFVINPTVPNIPVTVQTIIQSPAICTTVCIVDRRR
jgi:hypothetical protein